MNAFKVHLGLLGKCVDEIKLSDIVNIRKFHCAGVIVKVTLQTETLYKTLAHNYVVKDDILTNGVAINIAETTDQVSLYWFPTFGEVIIANWTIVNASTPGNAFTNDHVPSITSSFALMAATAKEFAFSLTSSTCQLASSIGTDKCDFNIYLLKLPFL